MDFILRSLFALLVIHNVAFGIGRIEGRVIDKNTKEPLIGVNVLVTGQSIGASTDNEGRYRIDKVPLGMHRLQFSYIGYETRVITDIVVNESKSAIVNAELAEEIFQGQSVVVTAGYFVDEEVATTSTIGLRREEIRRFPGGFEDVVRTVSTLPGVTVTNTGGRNDLFVRGGGPSENLYVVNNIEIPNINHFGTQGNSSGSLSFINLDFIDKVTFSSGGFGASFGDKMSSVLKLDLSEGRSDRLGFKTLISATQFGANIEGPIGKHGNFIFSGRKSYLDLIFKAAGLPFVPVYTDFNLLGNYTLNERDKLTFVGLTAIDRVDRNLSTADNRLTNSGIMDNTQNQYISGLSYRHILSEGYFDLTANYNLNQYRFSQADTNQIEYFRSRADESEAAVRGDYFHAFGKQIGIKAGLSQKFVMTQNKINFADIIYDRNGKAISTDQLGIAKTSNQNINASKSNAYLESNYHILSNFEMNGGLRLDHYSFLKDKNYWAPRIAAQLDLSSKIKLKSSAGTYYQSPSYVWMVNPENRKLKALKNNMIVLGTDYLYRDDTRFSLETYYKDYQDLPTGTIAGVNDYLVITNTGSVYGGREDDFQSFGYFPLTSEGKGSAYGLEFLTQKRFSDLPFYGQLAISYSKSTFRAGNNKTYSSPYDQRFVLNISGGYRVGENWEFSGKFRYFTGVPYTPVYRPEENTVQPGLIQNLPDEYLSRRLSAGHHLDMRVDRYFNFRQFTLIAFIDIQNVYNNKLAQIPRYDFAENKVRDAGEIGILPSIGISFEY